MVSAPLTSGVEQFHAQGFEILPGFVDLAGIAELRRMASAELETRREPIEYEADVGYPGAPANRDAPGGSTPRRLLTASSRDPAWLRLATLPALASRLRLLIGEEPFLSPSHHNCVMTKHPGFSSETHWHQDIRYWSFKQPELVSAWFALTEETEANGALMVIPGSHRLDLESERFDEHLFLRPDHAANRPLIDSAVQISLRPGDLLLFHCRTLHAAGRNATDQVKLSAVYTYHGLSNLPLPGTKSSRHPPISLRENDY